MIRLRKGKVLEIIEERPGLQELLVEVEGEINRAINYTYLTGPCNKGDEVALNTTAVFLKLGSGGYHFVLYNCSIEKLDIEEKGHIMKLRYTPFQVKTLSGEESSSPLAEKLSKTSSLSNMPVVIGSLHSMLAPACAGIKKNSKNLKVAYVMTDGGALPIFLSQIVTELKEKGLLDLTITTGHAFGGDLEAVNIFSGLLLAKASGCDVAVVTMGPGIVGTGTKYGHTGLEQGEIINAVRTLRGIPVAIPRISFADHRTRHYGVSHHTITSLREIALRKAFVVIPKMEKEKFDIIMKQLKCCGIHRKHRIVIEDGIEGIRFLKSLGIEVHTMGRNFEQDREFFLAASAAGNFASKLVENI